MNIPDDPFIKELLPEFIDSWITDIETQFQPLIIAQNSQEMYRFGHTIKGSCLQFGLDEVAALGIELMGYAKEENWVEAAKIEGKLLAWFDDLKRILL